MSARKITKEVASVLKNSSFILSDGKFTRRIESIDQSVNIYTDKIDGYRYIEFSVTRSGDLLVSGRADRAFPEARWEIISAISGRPLEAPFELSDWLSSQFVPMLDEMSTFDGVLKVCRDRLDGRALITALVRHSWEDVA